MIATRTGEPALRRGGPGRAAAAKRRIQAAGPLRSPCRNAASGSSIFPKAGRTHGCQEAERANGRGRRGLPYALPPLRNRVHRPDGVRAGGDGLVGPSPEVSHRSRRRRSRHPRHGPRRAAHDEPRPRGGARVRDPSVLPGLHGDGGLRLVERRDPERGRGDRVRRGRRRHRGGRRDPLRRPDPLRARGAQEAHPVAEGQGRPRLREAPPGALAEGPRSRHPRHRRVLDGPDDGPERRAARQAARPDPKGAGHAGR